MQLFHREATVEIIPEGTGLSRIFQGRIKFDIELDNGGEANKAVLLLFNVNDETFEQIDRDKTQCDIKAGYAMPYGEGAKTIFRG